jgi:hypothetical protein
MATRFTAKAWATLNDLVRQFERAPKPARSPERRDLRRRMRDLGYYASSFGLRNTTRADLQRLLDEGVVRIIS